MNVIPQMRAFAVHQWADSYKDSGNVLVEMQVEIPKAEGRDLLVEIRSVATNPVDLKKVSNFGNSSADFPESGRVIAGWDAAGVVVSVGEQVSLFQTGDEVMFAGSIMRDGCFSQFALVDERLVGKKPSSISFADASALPLTCLTAWESMVELANIPYPPSSSQKRVILITGGAGGVGSIAIQLARHVLNIETVVATASREETSDWCKKMGATHVINHYKPLKGQLEELGISGVDTVFHCVDLTVETFDQFVDICNPLAHIVFITSKAAVVDVQKLTMKRLTISGEIMYSRSIFGYNMEKQGEILNMMADLMDSKTIQSHVNQRFPFTLQGLKSAFSAQGSNKSIGKNVCVLE